MPITPTVPKPRFAVGTRFDLPVIVTKCEPVYVHGVPRYCVGLEIGDPQILAYVDETVLLAAKLVAPAPIAVGDRVDAVIQRNDPGTVLFLTPTDHRIKAVVQWGDKSVGLWAVDDLVRVE